ncbi:hypothetical protein ABBQ32_003639 [Trebouxia sp. C0010 RCD-2024]
MHELCYTRCLRCRTQRPRLDALHRKHTVTHALRELDIVPGQEVNADHARHGRGMCYSIYKVFSRQAVLVASVPRQFLCRVDQQSQQGSQISCSPAVSHCKALGQEDNMLEEDEMFCPAGLSSSHLVDESSGMCRMPPREQAYLAACLHLGKNSAACKVATSEDFQNFYTGICSQSMQGTKKDHYPNVY